MVGNYLGQICMGGQNDFSCITSPYLAIKAANTGGVTTLDQGCAVNTQNTSGFAAAIAAAKAADVVVLALGINQSIEGEGHDRVNITLPGVQPEFADAIVALGKPTVVVLINGGIVAIDKLKTTAPAMYVACLRGANNDNQRLIVAPCPSLEAFYPGYQGGNALASIIFGDYNPGAKLPTTSTCSPSLLPVKCFSTDLCCTTVGCGVWYPQSTRYELWCCMMMQMPSNVCVVQADYIDQVNMLSMRMEPDSATHSPGRSYRYFIGTALWRFGFGLSCVK